MTEATEPDIDCDCIVKLKTMLAAAYPRMVQSFLANTENYIGEIAALLGAHDRQAASAVAHKMKSSCGQFGLPRLHILAKQIERSENLDDAGVLALSGQLKPAYAQALAALKAQGLDG